MKEMNFGPQKIVWLVAVTAKQKTNALWILRREREEGGIVEEKDDE